MTRLARYLNDRSSNLSLSPLQAQSTTSKPVEPIPEEDEAEGEEAFEESEEHEAPTTTTESAKKLRNGGVRPFRYLREAEFSKQPRYLAKSHGRRA